MNSRIKIISTFSLIVFLFCTLVGCNKTKIDDTFINDPTNFFQDRIVSNHENVVILVDDNCPSCQITMKQMSINSKLKSRYNFILSFSRKIDYKKYFHDKNIAIENFSILKNSKENNQLHRKFRVEYPSFYLLEGNALQYINSPIK